MKRCDRVIRASHILTQNSQREIIANGALAITNGIIAAIGSSADIDSQWQAKEVLDFSGHLLMPGLINSHTHAAMTFLRGLADDKPLLNWLRETVFPVEKRLTREIVKLGTMLGYAEMLATGTTACMDMYIFEDAVLEAADICGIRCTGGEAIFQFPSAACPDYKHALDQTAALAEKYRRHERIGVAVNPHSVYTTSPAILRECARMAEELDLPVHIHLAETKSETADCLEAHGMRPVSYLESLDMLNERLVAAHLVDLSSDEIARIAQAKVRGVHNPGSNMKLASGVAPLSFFFSSGMLPGLGTDGPASNNQLNMFQEMSRAALLHKLVTGNPEAAPAAMILDMATFGGANVLGLRGAGSLQEGFKADMIALDLSKPNMQPFFDPVSQVVYASSGYEVELTMVEGEVLYNKGQYTRFDYKDLLREVGELKKFALNQSLVDRTVRA